MCHLLPHINKPLLFSHSRQQTQLTHIHPGKNTFLNAVQKLHKCTYICQYHNLWPYVEVSTIPNFDTAEVSMHDLSCDNKNNTYDIAFSHFTT
jgi:hypothetical protein